MTIGTITYAVQMLNRLYRPVQSLLSVQVDFTRSLALFVRIFEYLDMKSEIKTKEGAVKPDLASGSEIEFRNVFFSYSGESDTLSDISFVLPNGRMYAIVGPSGAGKSTIVSLIPRLYDVRSGSVAINGVDVRDIDLEHLRGNIGIVSQDTYLFNATIKENLRYANEQATDEEVEEACKAANIHDFVMAQPLRYETVVGNRGLKLSGGEKQRISIARVILKDPKILVLDEATSSLDSISEHLIQEALDSIMKGRTCIVIAHRLSTILSADKILVVRSGQIVEEGRHEDLLDRGGVYKQLYETQFREVLDKELSASYQEAERREGSYNRKAL
jgi:ATP-binding cassette subfamily B protein